MTFRDWFIPPRRLPFPHWGLLASVATQASGDIACGPTCLPNQHEALNCLPVWFQLLTMGNCTWGPLRVPIVLRNLGAHTTEAPAKAIVGQVAPANQVPAVVLPMEFLGGSTHDLQQGWILEALSLQSLGGVA